MKNKLTDDDIRECAAYFLSGGDFRGALEMAAASALKGLPEFSWMLRDQLTGGSYPAWVQISPEGFHVRAMSGMAQFSAEAASLSDAHEAVLAKIHEHTESHV